MAAVGGNPTGGRGSTPCAWCHKRHRSGTYCRVKTRETTPRKHARKHIMNDVGDCVRWCEACREERAEREAKAAKRAARKPMVAWAVVLGDEHRAVFFSKEDATDFCDGGSPPERVIELVEADPAADAVVRAARKWLFDEDDDRNESTARLIAAIERVNRLKGGK